MVDTQVTARAEAPHSNSSRSEWRENVSFFLKLLLFIFILRSFISAPFYIPSGSMIPRLVVGDYLLITKWNYGYSRHSLPFSMPLIPGRIFSALPERGDVVVFKAPPANSADYIKRVIGLPGDMVEMRGGQIILNGKPVPKTRIANFEINVSPNTRCELPEYTLRASDGTLRCSYPQFEEVLPNGKTYRVLDLGTRDKDDTEVFVVPQGHLFMMGDNRDNSEDSRYPAMEGSGIGFVPVENLVGKAWISIFSTDGSANWLLPWTWFSAARGDRIGDGF